MSAKYGREPSRKARVLVWVDSLIHSESQRQPGPLYRRRDDFGGIFDKTLDVVGAVEDLRRKAVVGYPFTLESAEGLKVTGYANVPAILVNSGIRPKVSFEYYEAAPC